MTCNVLSAKHYKIILKIHSSVLPKFYKLRARNPQQYYLTNRYQKMNIKCTHAWNFNTIWRKSQVPLLDCQSSNMSCFCLQAVQKESTGWLPPFPPSPLTHLCRCTTKLRWIQKYEVTYTQISVCIEKNNRQINLPSWPGTPRPFPLTNCRFQLTIWIYIDNVAEEE